MLPSPEGHQPVIAVVGERSAAAWRDQLSWFESKPLFGWRVLVPRTKEQAASLSDQLRSYGAVPHEVPTIAVEPPRTPQQMERAVKGLVTGRYEWIAFTSVNAVKAVREKFEEYGLDARAFAGIKVAAVGEQTAGVAGRVRRQARSGAVRRAVRSRTAGGLAALRPGLRPDRPGLPAARRHRHRDAGGRAHRTGLGGRRRHRLPHGARVAAAGRDPRGDQGRRLRRGALHLVQSPSATWSASRASRTTSRSSPVSARPPPRRPRSTACGSTSCRPSPRCTGWPRPSPRSGRSARRRRRRRATRSPAQRAAPRRPSAAHHLTVGAPRGPMCSVHGEVDAGVFDGFEKVTEDDGVWIIPRRPPPAAAHHPRDAADGRRDPARPGRSDPARVRAGGHR